MSESDKPSPLLVGRRCLLIGGAAALGLAACGGGAAPVPPMDGGSGTDGGTDSGTTGSDAGMGAGNCPSDAVITDAPSTFTQGNPAFYADAEAFIIRDAQGLYALSAICTHQGCQVTSGGFSFYCPCHGSSFDINGNVTVGPARQPLPHYALCLTGDGKVGIGTAVVSSSTRLKA